MTGHLTLAETRGRPPGSPRRYHRLRTREHRDQEEPIVTTSGGPRSLLARTGPRSGTKATVGARGWRAVVYVGLAKGAREPVIAIARERAGGGSVDAGAGVAAVSHAGVRAVLACRAFEACPSAITGGAIHAIDAATSAPGWLDRTAVVSARSSMLKGAGHPEIAAAKPATEARFVTRSPVAQTAFKHAGPHRGLTESPNRPGLPAAWDAQIAMRSSAALAASQCRCLSCPARGALPQGCAAGARVAGKMGH